MPGILDPGKQTFLPNPRTERVKGQQTLKKGACTSSSRRPSPGRQQPRAGGSTGCPARGPGLAPPARLPPRPQRAQVRARRPGACGLVVTASLPRGQGRVEGEVGPPSPCLEALSVLGRGQGSGTGQGSRRGAMRGVTGPHFMSAPPPGPSPHQQGNKLGAAKPRGKEGNGWGPQARPASSIAGCHGHESPGPPTHLHPRPQPLIKRKTVQQAPSGGA